MLVDERLHCVAGEQRGVAGQHDNRTCGHLESSLGNTGERNAHGMAGTQLLVLHHGDDSRCDGVEMSLDLLAAVADDHNHMARLSVSGRVDDVAKE